MYVTLTLNAVVNLIGRKMQIHVVKMKVITGCLLYEVHPLQNKQLQLLPGRLVIWNVLQ